jgi:hypothetical protein
MTLKFMHLKAASLAIAMLSLAAPALAQDPPPVAFESIRDAVPGRFFSPVNTGATAESPNTLQIGFESGANAFKACAPSELPLSPLPCSNTRVAMDTLSFVVRAPAGYYVSSLTVDHAGTGAISRLADARGASAFVVAGEPVALGGPFGGAAQFTAGGAAWSRSRTIEFTDSQMTVVPVSLTTGLFAYAGADAGSARVELVSATVAVTIAPLEETPPPVKKTATIQVVGFSGTYDGDFHGATGTAFGPDGEDLSHRLEFGAINMFQNVPGGTVHWTFPADETYNGASGTAEIVINPAAATIAVTGFTGTYDGLPHQAVGTATGISAIVGDLNAHLDLGAAFTDAPGGTATWVFGGNPNYQAATGTAAIIINKATPVLTWPQPAAIAAGTALSTTQLNATANVPGAFVYTPPLGTTLTAGTHTLSVAFTPAATVNYNNAAASVSITVNPAANSDLLIVNPGPQSNRVGDKVRLQIHVTAGVSSHSGDDDDNRRNRGGRLKGEYSATGLPAGLFIEDDGEIRGTLTTAGTHRTVVTFTPRQGAAVSTAFDWTVLPRSSTNGK